MFFGGLLLGVIVAAFGTVAAGVAETYLLKTIIDEAVDRQFGSQIGNIMLLLAVLTVGATATYFRFKLSGYFSGSFVYRLNQRLFQKVTRMSIAALEHYDAGDVVARFSSDIRKINTFAEVSLPLLILHPIMFVMGAAYLAALDGQLLLLSIIPIPVGFLLIMLMTRSMSPAVNEYPDLFRSRICRAGRDAGRLFYDESVPFTWLPVPRFQEADGYWADEPAQAGRSICLDGTGAGDDPAGAQYCLFDCWWWSRPHRRV